MIETLLENERTKIAEALEEVSYKEGDSIVKQGDAGDVFYIIRKGKAIVWKKEEGAKKSKEVMRLGPGDFFGERALIKNDVRAATVVANSDMECVFLDREAFTLVLGPLGDILNRKIATEYDKIRDDTPVLSKTDVSQSNAVRNDFIEISLEDLNIVGTLGKGSFGHVRLVKHKKTKQYYALKTVHKAHVVQLGQQEHIINEKNVLTALNSPFLIKLWATHKDSDSVYFILEPILGGELFALLRDKTAFDEKTSKFYAACVGMLTNYLF